MTDAISKATIEQDLLTVVEFLSLSLALSQSTQLRIILCYGSIRLDSKGNRLTSPNEKDLVVCLSVSYPLGAGR